MYFEHKIERVYTKGNNILICEFENGIKKKLDINIFINKYPILKKIKEDEKLFKKARVDVGGYGIVWNEEIDFSAEGIWENGEEINED